MTLLALSVITFNAHNFFTFPGFQGEVLPTLFFTSSLDKYTQLIRSVIMSDQWLFFQDFGLTKFLEIHSVFYVYLHSPKCGQTQSFFGWSSIHTKFRCNSNDNQ